MKRLFALLLIASLSACTKQGGGAYPDAETCIAGGRLPAQTCQAAAEKARQSHPRVVRKFSTRDACEAVYGYSSCETISFDGYAVRVAGVSAPRMAGFVVGRDTDSIPAQPVYRHSARYETATGRFISKEYGFDETMGAVPEPKTFIFKN